MKINVANSIPQNFSCVEYTLAYSKFFGPKQKKKKIVCLTLLKPASCLEQITLCFHLNQLYVGRGCNEGKQYSHIKIDNRLHYAHSLGKALIMGILLCKRQSSTRKL